MNFKEKVQSMTAKEIVMAMVDGLQKEHVSVDMRYFGGVKFGKFKQTRICYGCAATNAICEISGKVFTPSNIEDLTERAKFLGVDEYFLNTFELAIDMLRNGSVNMYNSNAKRLGIALMPASNLFARLPVLGTDNYKLNLQYYIDYANSL